MTAEKYVNDVTRRIKCGSSRRKEIRQQLLSDISAELEQGKSLEDVIKRMGDARDLAREFNENMSVAERKKNKIKRIAIILTVVVAAILALAALVSWYLPKTMEIGTRFDASAVEARMREVVEQFNDRDYEALRAESVPQMASLLTEEYMDSARRLTNADWGDFRSFGSIALIEVTQMGSHYAVGEISVVYEKVSIVFRLSFDEELRLAGLYMR